MKEDSASRTADRVAERRAAHQVLDTPRVFDDPLALRIIRPEAARLLRDNPKAFDTIFDRLRRTLRRCRWRPRCLGRRRAELHAAGFGDAHDLGPDDINAAYFVDRRDGLKVSIAGRIAHARVRR